MGFPRSFPAAYFQVWSIYCSLLSSFQGWRCVYALCGLDTDVPFKQPLLRAKGVRDFWGRRWNLLVHNMMKRIVFGPLAGRVGPSAAAVAAFTVSGLFHEYMWLMLNWFDMKYMPGGPLLFFMSQFSLSLVEAALKGTRLGDTLRLMPRPAKTAVVTLLGVPFSPWFTQGLHTGGVMMSATKALPHFVLVA